MKGAARTSRWDLLWYAIIGLLVLLAIVAYVVRVPNGKGPSRKWTEFTFYSSMLFLFLSKIYWRYRSRLGLWLALLASFVVHLALYVPVLDRFDRSPALWYVVSMPLEGMLIMLLVWAFLRIPPDIDVRL